MWKSEQKSSLAAGGLERIYEMSIDFQQSNLSNPPQPSCMP